MPFPDKAFTPVRNRKKYIAARNRMKKTIIASVIGGVVGIGLSSLLSCVGGG
jgi:hypothetical protein